MREAEKPPGGRRQNIPDPWPAAGMQIDPAELRDRILKGESEFGRHVKPLVEKLVELPPERQTESLETLKLIHGFIRENGVPVMELTREDILFMLTDPVGNLIRRPMLHTMFANMLDEKLKAEGTSDRLVKDRFLAFLRPAAWSRFVKTTELTQEIKKAYPEGEVWVDYPKRIEEYRAAIRGNPMSAHLMLVEAHRLAIRFREENVVKVMEDERRQARGELKVEFCTDPSHAFNQSMDLMFAHSYVAKDLGMGEHIKMPALLKPCTFMLVEDNPLHALLADVVGQAQGMTMYKPTEGLAAHEELTGRWEEGGVYTSAERALEVIYGNVGGGGTPPDIILSDIELLGEMNGIQFVREVYDREKAAGRNPMILMVYSSNPGPYMGEVEKLKADGIIVGSWHKNDFRPERMIETVNEELKRRS